MASGRAAGASVHRRAMKRASQGGAGEGESPGFYSSKPSERYARGDAGGGSSSTGHGGGRGGFGGSGGSGENKGSVGTGNGGDGPAGDAEFAANNPYAALPAPGMAGSPSMLPGGMGNGSGYAAGAGMVGSPGPASQAAWPVRRTCFPAAREMVRAMGQAMQWAVLPDLASQAARSDRPG